MKSLFLVVAFALSASAGSDLCADFVLFDNGAPTGSTGRCDSGPDDCSGTGNWTYYDDFSLGVNATLSGVDFTSLFWSGGPFRLHFDQLGNLGRKSS